METEQPIQTISPEALRAFYAELGEKTMALHMLVTENARLKEIARQLMDRHGPGQCQPIDSAPEGGA